MNYLGMPALPGWQRIRGPFFTLWHLDYTTSEAGGASEFVREYTLGSGGTYCDCGYKKLRG